MKQCGFTAFIPAAGFGTRLRPITNHMPKALLPVLGQPLIGHVAARVAGAGASAIGVNAHHLPEMIAVWAESSELADSLTVFREHEVLGTGGAIWNARNFLRGEFFLLHNCDILSDIDIRRLIAHHEASGNLITLAVHDRPELNNLRLDAEGLLVDVVRALPPLTKGGMVNSPPFIKGGVGGFSSSAYTGIAVYSSSFIDFLPEGPSDVVAAWLRAVEAGEKIGTLDFTGCFWEDMGTPAAYASVVWRMLRADGERAYFDPAAKGCNHAALMGMAAVEAGANITGPVTLDHAIVLPGANVGGGEIIANSIAGPDYRIAIQPPDDAGNVSGGGSDRVYRRVQRDGGTAIAMSTSPGDPDYERQIAYSTYFAARGIPVPELFEADADARTAVFADLGDRSLYTFSRCVEAGGLIEPVYLEAVKIMAKFHAPFNHEAAPAFRLFDYEHLRWETAYFLNEFLRGHCGVEPADSRRLDAEFHALARRVDGFGKRMVHRDCQSQNIMIAIMVASGGSLYLIDYQGARLGPPAYDIASLLWDPYVRLPGDMRERLVEAYEAARKENEGAAFDLSEFRASLLPCRLQRHMQALGAYAFLSGRKGKKYFRKHIPAALEMLRAETELVADEMPELAGCVRGIR